MGALLGGEVVYAEPGDLVFKPRQQWHTFWNAGDEPCRILEIISPSGFEHFFNEMGDTIAATDAKGPGDVLPNSDLPERYAIEFQPERTAEICQNVRGAIPRLARGLSLACAPAVIPSGARNPHRPDRGLSTGSLRIPHCVRNDSTLGDQSSIAMRTISPLPGGRPYPLFET